MAVLGDLFQLLRDTGFSDAEEEANREVVIALGGNSQEARDKLNRALNTRLESLWTTSPFRLVDTNERPKWTEDEVGGLFLYALYEGEHIPTSKRTWLKEMAASPNIGVIIAVLPREEGGSSRSSSNFSNRLQLVNPLRLIGGDRLGAAGADGAAFNTELENAPTWESELTQLEQEAGNKLAVVRLKGLELNDLQNDLLPRIVQGLPGSELALARRAPVFRNAVAMYLINKAAKDSTQTILLANLTTGVPFVSGFFGSGGDFLLLTRNQINLGNQLASVYGQKRDSRVEVFLEMAPIVGLAFLWRSLARRSSAKMPQLAQTLPKAAIAYGATWVVGRVAQLYYSSGRKAPAQLADLTRRTCEQLMGVLRKNSGDNNGNQDFQQKRSS